MPACFVFLMNILLLLVALVPQVFAFIEPYQDSMPIVILKDLKKSTVTLSDVKVFLRRSPEHPWLEMEQSEDESDSNMMHFENNETRLGVELLIYESPTKEWTALTKVGVNKHTANLKHQKSSTTFLWTVKDMGMYMFLYKVVGAAKGMEVGLEIVIYEGRPEDPSIYSHTDSQIRIKEKRIGECISVAKEIVELQDLDQHEEVEYTKATNAIFRAVLFTVFLKVAVFAGSFVFINRKIQKFYIDKKIVVK